MAQRASGLPPRPGGGAAAAIYALLRKAFAAANASASTAESLVREYRAGAQAMARCLTHNVHMQSINLTHNCITQVGKCISLS